MIELGYTDDTWKALVKIITEKIEHDRDHLESIELSPEKTALHRGRISAFKELLALPIQQAARARIDEPQ